MYRALTAAVISVLLFLPGVSTAGWIIEQESSDFPGERISLRLQAGRVRLEGFLPGLVFMLDTSGNVGQEQV